ncbi:hypothetical protein FUAX_09440 [Fulvitalea axinellae]|uniref:SDR family NAD(P)-dependent oxidoreductase n=1 Tax=Fulvitalea axinellae TaxID=1182444 RepID=A0AAU9CSY8_9BACT|nr:hypothetical protein FUAX_09440 [Fulvitalea axinellae]
MENATNTYAVITGASQGLGKCLALECAKRGMNLILVSLSGEGIGDVGQFIEWEYSVNVKTFEADLTDAEQLQRLVRYLKTFEINVLLNNAGIGGTKPFSEASENYIDNIIFLNIRALVSLTKNLLPILSRQKSAHILNIASMASFGAMPFKTVYPASKAFVKSFSRGLACELEGTGVRVSVAYPGGMPTNKEVSDRINRHGGLVRSTILGPEKVAEICIREMLEGKEEITPGMMTKLSRLFFKLCPESFRLAIFRKNVLREIHEMKTCHA